MDNTAGSSLIDNFEASFMNCIHSFTKQESAIDVDKGEIKFGSGDCIFIDKS